MAEETNKTGRKQLEEEVWSAIGAFEQILEAMPDDRASLETLSHAYSQIGDHAKAYEYLLRLGRVLVAEGDQAAALGLVDRLREVSGGDAEGIKLIGEIEDMAAPPMPTAAPSPAVAAAPAPANTSPSISDELAFTWNLLQAGELNQEEYASVVQDLTEMSGSESSVSVSVLHALEARGFKGLDRVLVYVAQECSTPYISLDSLAITDEAGALLPLEFVVRRGALVFDFVGSHALAVVMNPCDQDLRKEVERLVGKPCHYYVTHASEFDRAVERITDIEVEAVSQGS
ncbi:MAG: hypothetical protein QGH42_09115 [Kiritimatiellia bacterium]|nr:hypothetical protein [Kiritimatiellia bacterium]MDP6629358.1 hypothetical protein [Kiritimatiellia bacterium]MDP6811341.1 hypothetical protein [Kiritimatiellia bacterium]MDP7024382.1 hypothetical protein [Kiritimatiellia bacterium]